jgi:hypothetical protein
MEQTGQASKHTNKQTSKQANKQTNTKSGKHATAQTGKHMHQPLTIVSQVIEHLHFGHSL